MQQAAKKGRLTAAQPSEPADFTSTSPESNSVSHLCHSARTGHFSWRSPLWAYIFSLENMASPSAVSDNASSVSAIYPAVTKQAAGLVNGICTDVKSILFADKIMITISQNGRLAQWVRCDPLRNCSASYPLSDTRTSRFIKSKFR